MSDRRIIFARMDEASVDLIKKVSKARGETLSNFVRRATLRELARLSYLTPEEKKALGIATAEEVKTR